MFSVAAGVSFADCVEGCAAVCAIACVVGVLGATSATIYHALRLKFVRWGCSFKVCGGKNVGKGVGNSPFTLILVRLRRKFCSVVGLVLAWCTFLPW